MSREFLTYTNINNVLQQTTPVIITGVAATLLMISGGIDLSVGSVVALSGVVMAKATQTGIPMVAAIFCGIFVGLLIGLMNGGFVDRLHIPPVIVTMGSMYIARALALIFSNGKAINAGLPKNYTALGRGMFGVLSVPVLLTIALLLLFIFLEKKTLLGKYSFAIGGNKIAAIYSGIGVHGLVVIYYVLTGLLAGFAGCILGSRLGVGSPNVGQGFEFDVVVAVVLGGTSMSGGEGSVIGTFIGALIIGFLGNGLNLLGVPSFYQGLLKGFILVLAVILDSSVRNRLANVKAS
ncbi:ABC transporter permease [Treponema primitia]|uniref:ABC transporter permease n=1 Tax=Treponema primitia TaxID=88058 RepID=UPI0012FE1BB0|nr:ABC transporter permease [Treponema primitia]